MFRPSPILAILGVLLTCGCTSPTPLKIEAKGSAANRSSQGFIPKHENDGQPLLEDRMPVPALTTREDYYGPESVLQGPIKEWSIKNRYEFTFEKREGNELIFRFVHHEADAHAFFGERLDDSTFRPRNPTMEVIVGSEWRTAMSGGCYTAPETFLLFPDQVYRIKIYMPFSAKERPDWFHLRVAMDAGCWLSFRSESFDLFLRPSVKVRSWKECKSGL